MAPAVAAAATRFGPEAAADSFRGLYVDAGQADRALHRPAGEPLVVGRPDTAPPAPGWETVAATNAGWSWLRATYGLADVDLDVVLIALGTEVDLRYERLYGYLQDDVTRRRPTVGLALDLLAGSAGARLAMRAVFGSGAALCRHGLLRLVPDPSVPGAPLLAHHLVLDEHVVELLLGLDDGLDPRIAPHCRLVPAGPRPRRPVDAAVRAVHRLVRDRSGRIPPRVYLHGPAGSGRSTAATMLAAGIGVPLLRVDVPALTVAPDARDPVGVLLRTALRRQAVLYLDGVDPPPAGAADPGRSARERLLAGLADHPGVVVLAGHREWVPVPSWPVGTIVVPFERPGPGSRRAIWKRLLAEHDTAVDPADLAAVSGRFRLGTGEIRNAVLSARAAAGLRGAGRPSRPELYAAARAQTGHRLAALTRRIQPVHGWADLVLPPDPAAQLRELCERVTQHATVLTDWGFDRFCGAGGVTALFAGPPGTGKTMAAEVVAGDLGLDLYTVDLAGVVSKYIGETEKNLETIFTAAAETDAVLLFDEADALFGRRSEVRDAHDRYANLEVAYLLQRMEQHEGVVVLATNLRHHLDEAFTRRLQFVVDFPLPGEAERRRIWQVCLPAGAPLADDLDLDLVAAAVRLAGGHIRNITVAAAYRAAAEGRPIGMTHVVAATRREHQKIGRVMPALGPHPGDGSA